MNKFRKVRFFSKYFTVTHGKIIVRYTEEFVYIGARLIDIPPYLREVSVNAKKYTYNYTSVFIVLFAAVL